MGRNFPGPDGVSLCMRFLIFFLIWFSALGLAHWYLGRRVIRTARFTGRARHIAWGIVGGFYLLPTVPFFLFLNRVQAEWLDAVSWGGYVALGFFSLVLSLFLLRDGVLLIMKLAKRTGLRPRRHPAETDPERRRFMIHATNIGIIGFAAVSTGYGFYEARRRAVIERVTVPIAGLPPEFEGFRIAHISDIHVGPTIKREFVEGIVEDAGSLKPDMIAFTGDWVDGSVSWLKDDVAPLRELRAPHGTFFVTGNHEYYSGAADWIREGGRLGMDVLMNEHRVLERGGGRLVVAGVTDFTASQFSPGQASDPARAMDGGPSGVPRILLAHQPRTLFAAQKTGFDLQLSGHTHGGQFFPWNYMATLQQPYIQGLHRHGSGWIYVNRGTGYWGPPLRLGIPPEVTLLTLARA